MLLGGSLRKGKTSSVELDSLYQRYLPSGRVFSCTFLPDLAPRGVRNPLDNPSSARLKRKVESRLRQHPVIYLPLFSCHHWIAGILSAEPTADAEDDLVLRIYDSAPSHLVHRDLIIRLNRVWPLLRLKFIACQRQERGSDDCGLFMTANFFAHHLGVTAVNRAALPADLRIFLHTATLHKPSGKKFLEEMRAILTHDVHGPDQLEGGAPVEWEVGYTAALNQARRNGFGYMLAASVLCMVASNRHMALSVAALRERVRLRGFPVGVPQPVEAALRALGHVCLHYGERDARRAPGILEEVDVRGRNFFFVVRNADTVPLPPSIDNFVFVVGSEHHADVQSRTGQLGHDTVTRTHELAAVGLYVLREEDVPAPPQPRRRTAPGRNGAERARRDDPQDEMDRALTTALSGHLNWTDRYPAGCACPRDWFIHPGKPPHVPQVAWAAMNPQVRIQHRQWLENLRAMPADLLTLPLHTAAIELVRRMGCARHWKWSTMSRHLASIQAALLQLPMYTNQEQPVDLSENPDWVQALAGARRFEQESTPQPPEPLSVTEYTQVHRSLQSSPEALAFLALMWSCAARAGDIAQLLVQDLHFGDPIGTNQVRLQVTVRRGKGARFRGPYAIPTVLTRQDASLVQGLMAQRGTQGRLFPDDIPLRTRVREAIKAVNSSAALPSLRKGAARNLAAQGVPEQTLMRITGHTRLETLRRYLGYGLQATAEDAAAQDSVARAQQRQSTSVERPPPPATSE